MERTFTRKRETKGTVVFEEKANDDELMVGDIYIRKTALQRLAEAADLDVTSITFLTVTVNVP